MSVHIIVCIKSVVRSAPHGVARRSPENSELNPFDRPALEAALQIKAIAGGTVTAMSMGPEVAGEALCEARAMGADRAVLVSDRSLAGSDTLVTSRVLAAAIGQLSPYDLVLFGMRTADSDTGQVGAQTAALLQVPLISGVRATKKGPSKWEISRLMDDWQEQWQVDPPAALTIHPRAFAPRPVGLTGLAAAYEKNIELLGLSDLGLSEKQVGLDGSPTRVAALHPVKRRRTGELLTGETAQQVETLMQRLTERGAL